jgi:hypothetical protein
MNLKELRERGGIVPSAPVKHEVTWTRLAEDGTEDSVTFTVHVRKHSFGMIERLFANDGKHPDRSRAATFISESILLGDDGSERISYEDAFQLDAGLARVLVDAINTVNATGGDAAKN